MFPFLNLPQTPTDTHGVLRSFTCFNTLHVVGAAETQFRCCKLDNDGSNMCRRSSVAMVRLLWQCWVDTEPIENYFEGRHY